MTEVGGIRAVAAIDVKDWKSGIDYLKASMDVSSRGAGNMSKNLGSIQDRFREGTTGGLKLGMAFNWLEGIFSTLSKAAAGFGLGLIGYMTGALALSPHFSRFLSMMGVPFRELGRYLGEAFSPLFDKIVTLAGLFVGKLIQIGNETGIFNTISTGLGAVADALIKVVKSDEFKTLTTFLATSAKKVIDFELNVLDKYGLLGLLAQPAIAIALAVTMGELLGVGAGGLAGWLAAKLMIPTASIAAIAGALVISGILIAAEFSLAQSGDFFKAMLVGALATAFAAVTLGPAGAIIAGGVTLGVVFSGLVEETSKMKNSMLELGKLVDEHKISVQEMADKYGIVAGVITEMASELYTIKKLMEDIGLLEKETSFDETKYKKYTPTVGESSVMANAMLTTASNPITNFDIKYTPMTEAKSEINYGGLASSNTEKLVKSLNTLNNTMSHGLKITVANGGGSTTTTTTIPNHA